MNFHKPEKKKVRFIKRPDLIDLTEDFLKKYHSSSILPIPVEEIVELQLKIKIWPVTNLKKVTDVDSFLCSDMKRIIIDENCYYIENRCRFSLAHEVAHWVLHKDFFSNLGITDIDSYLKIINSIPQDQLKTIEQQAYIFAGYLLIPNKPYRDMMDRLVHKVTNQTLLTPDDAKYIISETTTKFQVSELAAVKQLKWEYPELFNNMFNNF